MWPIHEAVEGFIEKSCHEVGSMKYLIVTFLWLVPVQALSSEKEKIILNVGPGASIYKFFEDGIKDGAHTVGPFVDVLDCVFKKMGRTYELVVLPWKRAQSQVRVGRDSGFFWAARTDERDEFSVFSAITTSTRSFFTMKDSKWDPENDMENFKKNARIGAMLGTMNSQAARKHGFNVTDEPIRRTQLYKMLAHQRVDAAFDNSNAVAGLFAEGKIDKDLFKQLVFQETSLGIYFGKKFLERNSGFMDTFNSTLKICPYDSKGHQRYTEYLKKNKEK